MTMAKTKSKKPVRAIATMIKQTSVKKTQSKVQIRKMMGPKKKSVVKKVVKRKKHSSDSDNDLIVKVASKLRQLSWKPIESKTHERVNSIVQGCLEQSVMLTDSTLEDEVRDKLQQIASRIKHVMRKTSAPARGQDQVYDGTELKLLRDLLIRKKDLLEQVENMIDQHNIDIHEIIDKTDEVDETARSEKEKHNASKSQLHESVRKIHHTDSLGIPPLPEACYSLGVLGVPCDDKPDEQEKLLQTLIEAQNTQNVPKLTEHIVNILESLD
ncbi:unnamed protein product [Owenia fusiformis]|uniref:Uncharacterized protein n=1 Tax=Owenia fusiformis TaxID=6347 RepID=A0A8J1YBG3_OWEFU|nr:unnamed protein product [Owenia fusiformis]